MYGSPHEATLSLVHEDSVPGEVDEDLKETSSLRANPLPVEWSLVRRTAAVSLAFALVLASCSSDKGETTTTAIATATVSTTTTTTVPGIRARVGCGHAHNDYEHDRPLLDALENGFCSVEVDIWLQPEGLLVAHDLGDVDPARTLQSLYLNPLRRWIQEHGQAHEAGPLLLLVDVKSEPASTYASLHVVLEQYTDILTVFENGHVTEGAVTVVVSGNRDRAAMEAQSLRYTAMDGRLQDLGSGAPTDLIPLISVNWLSEFGWLGDEPLSEDKRAELRAVVDRAHAEGRLIRFWRIPDKVAGWGEMVDTGVDLINSDDIANLASFLAQRR